MWQASSVEREINSTVFDVGCNTPNSLLNTHSSSLHWYSSTSFRYWFLIYSTTFEFDAIACECVAPLSSFYRRRRIYDGRCGNDAGRKQWHSPFLSFSLYAPWLDDRILRYIHASSDCETERSGRKDIDRNVKGRRSTQPILQRLEKYIEIWCMR